MSGESDYIHIVKAHQSLSDRRTLQIHLPHILQTLEKIKKKEDKKEELTESEVREKDFALWFVNQF